MNYLEQSTIERKGELISKSRLDRYRMQYNYFYHGSIYNVLRIEPSLYAIEHGDTIESKSLTKLKQMKGEFIMLNLKKSNQAEPKKSFSLGTKQQTNKPGMTAEGIAAAAAIRNEMIAIKAEINGQNETVLNSLSVLTDLLKGIDARMQIVETELKNIKTVSTAMPKDASTDKQDAPQTTKPSKQGNALADTFKIHYKGKLAGDKPNEGQYDEVLNLLINSADASSREAFDNSISKVWTQYREEQSVFLYAAKNKQPVLNALWEAFNSQGKARTTQTETSPVFNKAYFADSLQVDEDVIKEILSAVKAAECFADDTEQEIVDYLIDNDCNADDSDIDQFITFCKDTFNG